MQVSLRHYLPFSLLSLITFTSCNIKSRGDSKTALRDSVTRNYLMANDSTGQTDTSNIDYKILKAYTKNDTAFFHQLQNDLDKKVKERPNWDLWNSDIPLTKLQNLNADEAYRFIFSVVSSPYYDVVTITKRQDSIKLYYVHFNRDDINYTPPQITVSDSTKLSLEQWDEFTNKLSYADFWGLKKENGWRATDGSDLSVIGYRKGNLSIGIKEKYTYVHRFAISTLNDAFFYVYFTLLDKKYKPY